MSEIRSVAAPDYRQAVQDDRIHGSLFTDPTVFADEMKTIFGKGWAFAAHDSEIPMPGDFVTRNIGLQSVIVVRGTDGACRAFYNRCPHRGAQLCQQNRGSKKWIVCPYHGWTFATDGRLADLPVAEAYPADFNPGDHGLSPVDQIDSYGGFIFVNLIGNGIPLATHLGRATVLIDDLLGLSPVGRLRIAAGWLKHRVHSNWKIAVENQVDGYHVQMVHNSLLKANPAFAQVRDRNPESGTRVRDMGQGHSDISFAGDFNSRSDRILRWTGGVDPAKLSDYVQAMYAAYGEREAQRKLVEGPPHSMLFPNISLAEMNLMVIEPVAPDSCIVHTTPVFLEGADDLNARTLRRCEGAMGPAGFLIADDAEIGDLTQRGMMNTRPEWNLLGRGLETEVITEDGMRVGGLMDETTQRGFWRHYRDVMAA